MLLLIDISKCDQNGLAAFCGPRAEMGIADDADSGYLQFDPVPQVLKESEPDTSFHFSK